MLKHTKMLLHFHNFLWIPKHHITTVVIYNATPVFMIFISKRRKDIFIFKYKASIYEVIKCKLLCRRVLQNTSKRGPPQWNFSYVFFRWFHGTIPFFLAAFFGGTRSFETLYKAYAHYFWDFIIFTVKEREEKALRRGYNIACVCMQKIP